MMQMVRQAQDTEVVRAGPFDTQGNSVSVGDVTTAYLNTL